MSVENSNSSVQAGFVRLPHILGPVGPIPVSRSTWWAGIRNGTFPKPIKISARITAWKREDIAALVASLGKEVV